MRLTSLKVAVNNAVLFTCFSLIFLLSQRDDPRGGFFCWASFQPVTVKEKYTARSLHSSHPEQSKHSLPCPWPLSCPQMCLVFIVLPRVSWMVSSSSHWVADTLEQERTPAMTHSTNTESREELHHILILHLGSNNNFRTVVSQSGLQEWWIHRGKRLWKTKCCIVYSAINQIVAIFFPNLESNFYTWHLSVGGISTSHGIKT